MFVITKEELYFARNRHRTSIRLQRRIDKLFLKIPTRSCCFYLFIEELQTLSYQTITLQIKNIYIKHLYRLQYCLKGSIIAWNVYIICTFLELRYVEGKFDFFDTCDSSPSVRYAISARVEK